MDFPMVVVGSLLVLKTPESKEDIEYAPADLESSIFFHTRGFEKGYSTNVTKFEVSPSSKVIRKTQAGLGLGINQIQKGTVFIQDSVPFLCFCSLLCRSTCGRQVIHRLEVMEVPELVFPLNVDLHFSSPIIFSSTTSLTLS